MNIAEASKLATLAAALGLGGILLGAGDSGEPTRGATQDRVFSFVGELEPGLMVDLTLQEGKGSEVVSMSGTAIYNGSRAFSFSLETTWAHIADDLRAWRFADEAGMTVGLLKSRDRVDVYEFVNRVDGLEGQISPDNAQPQITTMLRGDFSDVANAIGVPDRDERVSAALSSWILGFWKGGHEAPVALGGEPPAEPETCWGKATLLCGSRTCTVGGEHVTRQCVKSYKENQQTGACEFECFSYAECCGDLGAQ